MLARVEETLRKAGREAPGQEAWWILEAATKRDRAGLVTEPEISREEERSCERLAARRAAGEPLQYVTQVAGFRGLDLAVGPGVFIPRPETELVAERAMSRLPRGGTLVDVGTGSGAMALAVAKERGDATVLATESSTAALAWAERNQAALGVPVELVPGDLLSGLDPSLAGAIDVVVSNPPYIDRAQASSLPQEVVGHEPDRALFATEAGLDVLIRLADAAISWLHREGWLVLEIASDQAESAAALLGAAGYERVSIGEDLAGNPRIAEGQKP